MSSVRDTDSRQDAVRERLRDRVYARAYRTYLTSLTRRVEATIAVGRKRTRKAAHTIGSGTRAGRR
jgi:hypothetical protein